MGYISLFIFLSLVLTYPSYIFSSPIKPTSTVSLLMAIKASLDPENHVLSTWSPNATERCSGSFEGIACNELGQVVNISLQGKGLKGQLPAEIGQLKSLSGLYLHFNQLHGVVPKEMANLTQLSELYLNVNNITGHIPSDIGQMSNLQVLQLCYNKLTGSIPAQIGFLKKLNVLALQDNELTGAIPANLGDLKMLKRLDLSFNHLFGSIPVTLADPPLLQVLDIRNNTLSGNVPIALKKLREGFQYANNRGLCGVGFVPLTICSSSELNLTKPEPFSPGSSHLPSKDIPESANIQPDDPNHSRKSRTACILVVIGIVCVLAVTGLFSFSWCRRRKQKIGSAYDASDSRLSTDQVKEARRRSASPLISLEYSQGWDPLAKDQRSSGFSQEVFEILMFNLEEVESATQYFSEQNLLGKSSFSAIYKGMLRDESAVAIKCISKISCKSDESEFLKGLKVLTSLKHENILKLRGFCCSKGRGECFLIYDYVPNGSLLQYLDVPDGRGTILEWPLRVSIIIGIAKGIDYLHVSKGSKKALVHQNISAEKVLIDQRYKPLLSGSGLHKLLADDIVFSRLKSSAAMGYLAPEYTTTGRFTEKSDIYAFGMIILQILSGNRKITQLHHHGAELGRLEDFVDVNLGGKFSAFEAAKLGKIASLCTHEFADQRPTMAIVMQELNAITHGS
ncbi:hypothetical protein LIER_15658 [Lithospermum erythrorhizon]|uniref:Protein kinase domain-containing protein n=1 Tax=Lithospermum erythrorhizon TaxID=34254 RepID=A0AAV3Q7T6_LITER